MRYSIKLIVLILFTGLLAGCASQEETDQEETTTEEQPAFEKLIAVIHPTEGNDIEGVANFFKTDDGIRVVANVQGLEPMSVHGFHVHQFGDCSAQDGTSAGGHFNPHNMTHGAPTDAERHVGDLGNLVANEDGIANLDFVDTELSFEGIDSILGRGIIVHAGEDDLESQPTGDAGPRLGCAVIGVAQTE